MATGKNGDGMLNIFSNRKETIQSFGLTDKGCVRQNNQDAYLDANDQGFWVVADGAGGHEGGEIASNLIIEHLSRITKQPFLGLLVKKINHALQQVNEELITLSGGEQSHSIIASTVCVLIIHKHRAMCLWSGDSRIYLLRDKQLSQLTRDHNRMDEFIEAGMSREEAEQYPLAHYLTAAIGSSAPLFTETQSCEVKQGDRFLLCSDGLFKEVTDVEITSMMQQKKPKKITQQLMNKALSRQASDNVTALSVVVR
jgi:serine/threonine protein phosphatase PrpC